MKRFSQPGTVHTYGFSPGGMEKKSHKRKQGYHFIFNIRSCSQVREHTTVVGDFDVKGLTRVYPHMVLVVGGTGEWSPTARLRAVVRPLPGVCSDVNFADVWGGKRPATALDWTFKRLLSCRRETLFQGLSNIIPCAHNFSKPIVSICWYLDSNVVLNQFSIE